MAEPPPRPPEDGPADDETVVRPPDETAVTPADETVVDPGWTVPPERRVAVEEEQVQEVERRRLPEIWPWLLGFLILVLAGLGLAYYLANDDDEDDSPATTATATRGEVPVLVGLRQERAEERVREAGFDPKVEQAASAKPKGVVFEQDPEAGTEIARGDEVLLRVSSGPPRETVPDVVGQPFDEARADLEDAGLKVERRDAFGDADEGTVLAQDPAGGAKLAEGGTVTLAVSRGREPVEVPDVTGTTSSQATATLRDAGFDVNLVSVPSDEPAGTVIAQNPSAGAEAEPGSTVRLNVAQGGGGSTTTTTQTTTQTTTEQQPQSTTVPEAVGKELAVAGRDFARAGLKVAVRYVPSDERTGTVIAQAQGAGAEAKRGDTVQLNVSTGSDSTGDSSVPDVTGRTNEEARKALDDAGFEVLVLDWRGGKIANSSPVRSQSPQGGATVPSGVLVLIYVNS